MKVFRQTFLTVKLIQWSHNGCDYLGPIKPWQIGMHFQYQTHLVSRIYETPVNRIWNKLKKSNKCDI